MFKKTIEELHKLGLGTTVSIPVAADSRGYIDKECPAPTCLFAFKVVATDWAQQFRDEAVFCPRCGHAAPRGSWFTRAQIAQGRQQVTAMVESRVHNALVADARDFNAVQPRSGFLRILIKVSGARSQHVIVPIAAAALLEQTLVCGSCGAGCAVLGLAFFCPCCGHNSVENMFDGALTKVRTKIGGIEIVRQAVREAIGADAAETFCRSTIEGGLQDCVVAFQHLAERLYAALPGAKSVRLNVFQHLDDGSQLWCDAIGKGYNDLLEPVELEDLKVLFQRRHLLAHRDGLVDERYVQRSADTTYRAGQRIVVTARDVLHMVALVEKLATELRTALRPVERSSP